MSNTPPMDPFARLLGYSRHLGDSARPLTPRQAHRFWKKERQAAARRVREALAATEDGTGA